MNTPKALRKLARRQRQQTDTLRELTDDTGSILKVLGTSGNSDTLGALRMLGATVPPTIFSTVLNTDKGMRELAGVLKEVVKGVASIGSDVARIKQNTDAMASSATVMQLGNNISKLRAEVETIRKGQAITHDKDHLTLERISELRQELHGKTDYLQSLGHSHQGHLHTLLETTARTDERLTSLDTRSVAGAEGIRDQLVRLTSQGAWLSENLGDALKRLEAIKEGARADRLETMARHDTLKASLDTMAISQRQRHDATMSALSLLSQRLDKALGEEVAAESELIAGQHYGPTEMSWQPDGDHTQAEHE